MQLVALDKMQRLARYHGHAEAADDEGYRAMLHWGAVKFEECLLGAEEYDKTKSRLFEFQRDYEVQVAPLLIQADAQITRINEMFSVDWQDEEITLSLVRQKQALIRGCDYVWFQILPPIEISLWSDQQAMRLLKDSLLGPTGLMAVLQMSLADLEHIRNRFRSAPSESIQPDHSGQMQQPGPGQYDPPHHDASPAGNENQPQAWPKGQHGLDVAHQGPGVDPCIVAVGRSMLMEFQHLQGNPSATPGEELTRPMHQHLQTQHSDLNLQRDLPLPRQDRSWAQVVNPAAVDEHGHGDDEEDDLGWEEHDGAEHVSTTRFGGGKLQRHGASGRGKRRGKKRREGKASDAQAQH